MCADGWARIFEAIWSETNARERVDADFIIIINVIRRHSACARSCVLLLLVCVCVSTRTRTVASCFIQRTWPVIDSLFAKPNPVVSCQTSHHCPTSAYDSPSATVTLTPADLVDRRRRVRGLLIRGRRIVSAAATTATTVTTATTSTTLADKRGRTTRSQ